MLKIRLAGIAYDSQVNGPGMRTVIFSQGCRHNCDECFNPETHSMNGGKLMDVNEVLQDILCDPLIEGVTFSGGDPWEQADRFAYLAKNIKEKNPALNIWCYTGYTYEYIFSHKDERPGWKELLKYIDVMVDGKFDKNLKDSSLKFRGSSNQRLIDLKRSLVSGGVVLYETYCLY